MSALKKFSSLTGDDNQPEAQIELVLRDPGPDVGKSSLELTDGRPLPPVDGGTKAWSAIGGGFLALFVQFGLGKSKDLIKSHYGLPLLLCVLDVLRARCPLCTGGGQTLPLSGELCGLPRTEALPCFHCTIWYSPVSAPTVLLGGLPYAIASRKRFLGSGEVGLTI